MIAGQTIAVAMPAYYAENTLERTVAEIARDIADELILIDDGSTDRTFELATELGITALRNPNNLGYGGNVKRCLQEALARGADIVVLLHPDYQYSPKLIPAMASMVASGLYDLCLGSRATGLGARHGGMPMWRYAPNRALTGMMNLAFGLHHSEYHTGYRAYSRALLEGLDFHALDNGFIFDNQLLVLALRSGWRTCEITCPTVYAEDSRSIPFAKAARYGWDCLRLSARHLAWRIARGRQAVNSELSGHCQQP